MIFSSTKYYISAVKPLNTLNEVVFVGRSNVGKSSLINALCEHNGLAYVSKTPGHTKLLNYFSVGDKFYLVDAPGYGYRKLNRETNDFDIMMDNYFSNNDKCKLVIFLLDARRELSPEDIDFISFVNERSLPSLVVFTKMDKLNQSMKQKAINEAKKHFPNERWLFVSSLNKRGIEDLRSIIEKSVL